MAYEQMQRILVLLVLVVAATATQVSFYDGLVNTEIQRVIDIRSHVQEVVTQHRITNAGDKSADFFLVAFPAEKAARLSFFQAAQSDSAVLAHEIVTVEGLEAPAGTVFYKLSFAAPLEPQGTMQFQVLAAFSRVLVPFPAEITQEESQLVQFFDKLHIFSAYKTEKQSTQVKLGTSKVESYTKTEATLKGDEIIYGPFADVQPFSTAELAIHFENNSPFVTFTRMRRYIEVSHYGNVAVEDRIDLAHTGAALKGSFSRYLYQRNPNMRNSPSYRGITAFLPATATGIYYRDHIGNVSTSNAREGEDMTQLDIQPRFPMFGGWKTDFKIGYNVPASEFLSVDANSGSHYILNTSFASSFPQAAIDELEVRVILPEFATGIEWSTPFDIEGEDWESKTTYLDTVGRPVLVLRAKNVVRLHNQFFQVSYHYSSVYLYQEPALLILAFFLFFLASMVYMRFDLTISDAKSTVSHFSNRGGRTGELLNKFGEAEANMVSAYDRADVARGEPHFVQVKEALSDLSRDADSNLARLASQLSDMLVPLKGAAKAVSSSSKGKDSDALSKARSKYSARLAEFEALTSELSRS